MNHTMQVTANLRRWKDDRASAVPSPRPRKIEKLPTSSFDARKVEAKLVDSDVRGALRLLESEETIAPYND